jgi:hypothetical protein
MATEIDWHDRRLTKLCESCRGTGTKDTGPRFAGDDDERDVPYATPAPECPACEGRGRVLLGK